MRLQRTDPGGKQANDKMLPESTGQGVRADRRPESSVHGEQARADPALTGDPGGGRPFAVKQRLKAELSLVGLSGDSMSQSIREL